MDIQDAKRETTVQAASEYMEIEAALLRFQPQVEREMRRILASVHSEPILHGFYGQIAYHFGWVDEHLQPAQLSAGKLLRSALLMWGCVAAGATEYAWEQRQKQALPLAAAIEFIHNFTLIHDDIEDRDEMRRHRRTVWSIWGEAQGINTGDGMSFLGRLALWEALKQGVPCDLVAQLAMLLERTCLTICEGQYLDMSFEGRIEVTPEMYLDMITRKTAALIRAAVEMGARLGSPDAEETIGALSAFGEELGIAFQLRDDLLGIWSDSAQVGKTPAGDLRRKKMSLPIIHALTYATPTVRERIATIYQQPGPATDEQIQSLLALLNASASREWCRSMQASYCGRARAHFEQVRSLSTSTVSTEWQLALDAILDFVTMSV